MSSETEHSIPLRIKRFYSPGVIVYSSMMDDTGLLIQISETISVYWNKSGLIDHKMIDTFTWLLVT